VQTVTVGDYTAAYLSEVGILAARLDAGIIDRMIQVLLEVRGQAGRVFFLGVGGGAGHAGHAVNDFRKIAGIECYAPTDNVSELTARINDDGWESCYANWLRGSHLSARDAVFVFSVGGGSQERHISMNLVASLTLARQAEHAFLGWLAVTVDIPRRSRMLASLFPFSPRKPLRRTRKNFKPSSGT
jgi:D-sedoheptulose 7-phosphate isomerase